MIVHPQALLFMADRRPSLGLRWFSLLLLAEIALFALIYYLHVTGEPLFSDAAPAFNSVQRLNLQSLITAKGFSCPQAPSLHYDQHAGGVVIVAVCAQLNGHSQRYEIDFKGHVHPS
jgi:hypothetical protein